MSKIVFLGKWSIFKVVSMAKEVVTKVVPVGECSVPVAEGMASPPDGVVSGVGR